MTFAVESYCFRCNARHGERCFERYEVFCHDWDKRGEETGHTILASSHYNAALRWAEHYDAGGDYVISRGEELVLHVVGPDGTVEDYVVYGRASIDYHARPPDRRMESDVARWRSWVDGLLWLRNTEEERLYDNRRSPFEWAE